VETPFSPQGERCPRLPSFCIPLPSLCGEPISAFIFRNFFVSVPRLLRREQAPNAQGSRGYNSSPAKKVAGQKSCYLGGLTWGGLLATADLSTWR